MTQHSEAERAGEEPTERSPLLNHAGIAQDGNGTIKNIVDEEQCLGESDTQRSGGRAQVSVVKIISVLLIGQ